MPLGEITAALSAIKGTYEIAKGLKDIDDQVRLNSAVLDLQAKIIDAQDLTLASKEKFAALEAELEAYKNWEKTSSQYALRDFGNQTFAYEYQPGAGEVPVHLACPNCFQKKQLSILQLSHDYGSRRHFTCPGCNNTFALGPYEKPPRPLVRRSRVGGV
jgi:hypothetical protein